MRGIYAILTAFAMTAAPIRLQPPTGAPAIAHPQLVNIAWGDAPALGDVLPRLIADGYFADLAQYGVGAPIYLGERRASPACGASAPADAGPAVVSAFVLCEAATGELPPDWSSGRLIVNVLLPPSTRADLGGGTACYDSDGAGPPGLYNYHGNTANHVAGVAIPFTVVATGCADAAGGGSFGSPGAHLTWALTHEDVEAMTDPVPGQGWIDWALGGNGEAADVCAGDGGPDSAYWSNAAATCVRPGVGLPVPAGAAPGM